MTLIAGLVCRDAVVFAADSEESGGIRKASVEKIVHGKHGAVLEVLGGGAKNFCRIVVAGAGDGYLADHTAQRLVDEIEKLNNLKEAEAQAFSILQEVYKINVPLHPVRDSTFELLIGIKAPDTPRPILYSALGVTIVRRPRYFVCGSGSVVDYILDRIYQDDMAVEDGISAAVNMLQIAKEYVGGVGGKSNIISLDSEGLVKIKAYWEVSDMENLAKQFSQATGKLLLDTLRTRGGSDSDFAEALESFEGQIRDLRLRKKKSDELLDSLRKHFSKKEKD